MRRQRTPVRRRSPIPQRIPRSRALTNRLPQRQKRQKPICQRPTRRKLNRPRPIPIRRSRRRAAPAKTDSGKTEPAKTGTSKAETTKTTPPKTGADTSAVVEYDPVTDPKVRAQIRTLLANQKAAEEINKAFGPTGKLRLEVSKYSQARSRWRAKGSPADQEPDVPDFKELAKSYGVTFEQTGKVSAQEAQDQTELAKSSHVDETEFLRLVPFTSQAFDPRLPSYRPVDSASSDAETSYLWWRTDDFKDAYVPEFADVKADVLHAWKMIEARKLALAEAKTYADDANKRRSTLKEIFQNRANFVVKQVGPFHWLTISSVPVGMSMQQVPVLTRINELDLPGVEFMRTVFTIDVGSTAVAFNQPQTIAYVVQVENLAPPEDALRQSFLTYQAQSENQGNWGQAGLAAQFAAERVKQAKFQSIEDELGFKRLVPESSSGQRARRLVDADGRRIRRLKRRYRTVRHPSFNPEPTATERVRTRRRRWLRVKRGEYLLAALFSAARLQDAYA